MSVPHDFSRRFFADFIASRIRARSLSENGPRPANAGAEPSGDPDSHEPEAVPSNPIRERSGLRPGLGSTGI